MQKDGTYNFLVTPKSLECQRFHGPLQQDKVREGNFNSNPDTGETTSTNNSNEEAKGMNSLSRDLRRDKVQQFWTKNYSNSKDCINIPAREIYQYFKSSEFYCRQTKKLNLTTHTQARKHTSSTDCIILS